uniref:Uncharacterized protein n=2 Tax=Theileria annulata TaxID=5874 RepID=A0A3B0MYN9_THEAN
MLQIKKDSLFIRCGIAALLYYLPQDFGIFTFLSINHYNNNMRISGKRNIISKEINIENLIYNFMSDHNFTPATYNIYKRNNFTIVLGSNPVTVLGQTDSISTKGTNNTTKDTNGTTNTTNNLTTTNSTEVTTGTIGPSTVTEGKGANFTAIECTPGKGANSTATECTMERELILQPWSVLLLRKPLSGLNNKKLRYEDWITKGTVRITKELSTVRLLELLEQAPLLRERELKKCISKYS